MTASESTTIVECISDAITRRPRADHVKTTPLDWNLIQQKMKARGFDCDATRCELLWKFLSNGELPCRRSRGQKVDPLQSNKEVNHKASVCCHRLLMVDALGNGIALQRGIYKVLLTSTRRTSGYKRSR